MNEYEDLVIADLAETYNIYDYRCHPVSRVAIFVLNLRQDSRLMMKLAKIKAPLETILMAQLLDVNSLLLWSKTKDGQKGVNKPKQIAKTLIEEDHPDSEASKFITSKDFEENRRMLIEKLKKGGK